MSVTGGGAVSVFGSEPEPLRSWSSPLTFGCRNCIAAHFARPMSDLSWEFLSLENQLSSSPSSEPICWRRHSMGLVPCFDTYTVSSFLICLYVDVVKNSELFLPPLAAIAAN